MLPIVMEGTTHILQGPKGMPSLPVRVADGYIASRWVPNREELMLLIEGGSVELRVMGSGLPPVSLIAVPLASADEDG